MIFLLLLIHNNNNKNNSVSSTIVILFISELMTRFGVTNGKFRLQIMSKLRHQPTDTCFLARLAEELDKSIKKVH